MNSQKKRQGKWRSRQAALGLVLKQDKYDRLYYRAEALAKIFFIRRSLRLILCDTYLEKLWRTSRSTVQRTLKALEELGFLKRLTDKPRKVAQGKYTQKRVLALLLPSKEKILSLVRQFGLQESFLSESELRTQPAPKGSVESKQIAFVDYLATKEKVPLNAWLYWMRRWGAKPDSIGFLRKFHAKIANRADVLEAVLFDGQRENKTGRNLVGFIIDQIKLRLSVPADKVPITWEENLAGAEKIKRELGMIP